MIFSYFQLKADSGADWVIVRIADSSGCTIGAGG